MKRRSFLAGLAALPFVGAKVRGHELTKPVDLAKWKNYPVDVIFVGEYPNGRWIKDPFTKVNLDKGGVVIGDVTFAPDYLLSPNSENAKKIRDILAGNSDGTVSLVWGPDTEYTQRVRISYNDSFAHIIPLEDKVFDKGEFYTKITKNAPGQRLEFYHITYRGKNNLFVRTFESSRRGDLFISKEAMEDILNWTYRG